MEINVLIENSAIDGFEKEHGLSFYIRFNNKNYLLDAGQSDKFMKNAEKMHVDLNDVHYVALSHAHYDHGDGFLSFLKQYPKKIYTMKGYEKPYYSTSNDILHYIGLDNTLLTQFKESFNPIDSLYKIEENVFLLPHTLKSERAKKAHLFVKEKEELIYDDFSHEASLVFESEKGLIVFNSCSHVGIVSILEEVKQAFHKNIYAFIGGLHMKGKKEGQEICIYTTEEIQEIKEKVEKENIKYIYTGHCTGEIAYTLLKEEMPSLIYPLKAGLKIEI